MPEDAFPPESVFPVSLMRRLVVRRQFFKKQRQGGVEPLTAHRISAEAGCITGPLFARIPDNGR